MKQIWHLMRILYYRVYFAAWLTNFCKQKFRVRNKRQKRREKRFFCVTVMSSFSFSLVHLVFAKFAIKSPLSLRRWRKSWITHGSVLSAYYKFRKNKKIGIASCLPIWFVSFLHCIPYAHTKHSVSQYSIVSIPVEHA